MFYTSPSKNEHVKIFNSTKGGTKLNFGKDDEMDLVASDAEENSGVSSDNEHVEGAVLDEQPSDVAFHKLKMTEKQYGKYDSITKEEIFAINNYCRDSLWRRAKFINDRQLGEEFNNICVSKGIEPENRNHKYVDICLLIQNNMNYRRAYSTKRIRDLMVCE